MQLSRAQGVADTVQKIREGVIRNVSVGYWQHKVVKTESDGGTIARWDVIDWEPLEISAVPIPADAGSQIRSAGDKNQPETRNCTILISEPTSPPQRSNTMANKGKPSASRGTKTTAEIEEEKKRNALLAANRADDKDEDDGDEDKDDKDGDKDDDRDDDVDDTMDDSEKDDDGDDDARSTEDDDDEGEDKRASVTADVKRAAEAAVKAERIRIAKITEIARSFGMPKLGERHAGRDTSVRAFKDIVMARLLDQQQKRGAATFAAAGTQEIEARAPGASVHAREFEKGALEARTLLGIK